MGDKIALAIDLGATNTRVAVVSDDGKILHKVSGLTPHQGNYEVLIKSILDLIKKLTEPTTIIGVGICVPGFVNLAKGLLVDPPNLPYKNVPIVDELEKALKIKVTLNNDANAAAIGEKTWGRAKEQTDFAYLTLSSGIGGAIYQNNKIVTDRDGNSVELGHIEIPSEYNLACGCGGVNHWEAYASGTNISNFLAAWAAKNQIRINFDGSNVFTIFEAIENKNEIAVNFFEQLMAINVLGIKHLINNYAPSLITIGGSIYLNHQALFHQYLSDYPFIKAAYFGDDASLVGTAASVFS